VNILSVMFAVSVQSVSLHPTN